MADIRWDYPVGIIFAVDGERNIIPETDKITERVNYNEGFTKKYSTPVRDGGYNVERLTINELFYRYGIILSELQSKVPQIRHGVTEQGLDYTVTGYSDNTVSIELWGEYIIPPNTGSSSGGNLLKINLPYAIYVDRVSASALLHLPPSATGNALVSVDTLAERSITFKINSFSATEYIKCYLSIKAVFNDSNYPKVPIDLTSQAVDTVATIKWKTGA